MSDEVRQAAERLRLHYSGVLQSTQDYALGQEVCDLRELADAYLAEHTADSELPLDEEWLRSVGFKPDDERDFLWINNGGMPSAHGFDLMAKDSGEWSVADSDNEIFIPPPKTRGDVRRLASVLGIQLKGDA